MAPQEDLIVEIPENRLKFFGGSGKMLLPSPTTVAALIKKIPEHKLITTGLLCKELTQRFKVRGTCPVTTQKALQEIARDSANDCPYWRVVNAQRRTDRSVSGRSWRSGGTFKKRGFRYRYEAENAKSKGFQRKSRPLRETQSVTF